MARQPPKGARPSRDMRLLASHPSNGAEVPGRLLELRGDMQPRKMATQAVDTAGQNAAYRLACGIVMLDSIDYSAIL